VFTGLIQDLGRLEAREGGEDGARIRVSTGLAGELRPGDSVAVNGVCLTAVEVDDHGFAAEVVNQTLSVTSLGPLEPGDPVNLELPLRAGDRLGGHIVQGHVDGTGLLAGVDEDGFSRRLRIEAPPQLLRYAIERGSIAIDGVSLTISALGDDWFEVALIPETLERTNLGQAGEGARVNLEFDVLAKYVERLMSPLGGTGKG
jgi:riboflavin synthase